MSETALTSPHNAVFKKQQKILTDARFRRTQGLVWIEGERAVTDLAPASIDALLLGPDVLSQHWAVPPYRLNRPLADQVFITESPVEIGALVHWHSTPLLELSTTPWLVLDGLQDPGNVGTLIRSAAGLGAGAVILCHCADATNPKAVRSSTGALFRIPIAVAELTTVQELCRERHYNVVIADASDGSSDPANADVLVVGSEAHGPAVSWEGRRWSISLVAGVESLNAAAAGAILLDRAIRP